MQATIEPAATHAVVAASVEESVAQEYVISPPTGLQTASARFRTSLMTLQFQNPTGVKILDTIHEDAEKLALMTPGEVQRLKTALPGLVIEPNIRYKKLRSPIFDGFEELTSTASGSRDVTIEVVDASSGAPVPDATVYLIMDLVRKIGYKAVSDTRGQCRFTVRASTTRFDMVGVLPTAGYWNRAVKGIVISNSLTVKVQALPGLTPAIYEWGHDFASMKDGMAAGGQGITIGIIDTGIRSDHPNLRPAGGLNCVLGEDEANWDDDQEGHGTHCAGVIAALIGASGVKGYVPQTAIRSYRVFPTGEDAPTYAIVKAIKRAVEDGCDIISMSLGSATPQVAIRNQTDLAYERGVLCVAATGNDALGSVSYPAAFPSVIGVGAFGKFNSYPDDSLHKDTESDIHSQDGQYYLANFSNYGNDVDLCAPGVAIISTVPGGYSAWDGTSMACPQVAGIAALAMAAHPHLMAPRDPDRVDNVVKWLKQKAQVMGFGSTYEGAGALTAPAIVQAMP